MSNRKVWCVAWIDRTEMVGFQRKMFPDPQWCATFRGHLHKEEVNNVKTACGMVVTLPVGCEKRVPTCKECKARVARRRLR